MFFAVIGMLIRLKARNFGGSLLLKSTELRSLCLFSLLFFIFKTTGQGTNFMELATTLKC